MFLHRHFAGFLCVLALAAPAFAQTAPAEVPQRTSSGTGFFIHPDGYILTANHVVADCEGPIGAHTKLGLIGGNRLTPINTPGYLNIPGYESNVQVKVAAQDTQHDLALLKIVPNFTVDAFLKMRQENVLPKPQERVLVIGYPKQSWTTAGEFIEFITADGVVRDVQDAFLAFSDSSGTRAATTHGFSGGPVLDASGNVIGVLSFVTCAGNNCQQFESLAQQRNQARNIEEYENFNKAMDPLINTDVAINQQAVYALLHSKALTITTGDPNVQMTNGDLARIADSIVSLRCAAANRIPAGLKLGQ